MYHPNGRYVSRAWLRRLRLAWLGIGGVLGFALHAITRYFSE